MDLDLNKIKEHIQETKSQRTAQIEKTTGLPVTGDKFLGELVSGLNRGQTNGAVAQVKAVNQKTMVNDGERPNVDNGLIEQAATAPKVNVNIPQQPQGQYQYPPQQYPPQQYPPQQYPQQSGGEAGLYAEMQRKMEEMQRIQQGKGPQIQMNEGKVVPPQQPQYNPNNVLNEQITETVTNVFKQMGSGILQEAMKDTIVETYKMERVKESLLENKDIIKTIVIETIRELQNRKKAKTSS